MLFRSPLPVLQTAGRCGGRKCFLRPEPCLLGLLMVSVFVILTLCNPMDCSLSGSSVRGILQARMLEWVVLSFSRGSSTPRDQTRVSASPALAFQPSILPLLPLGPDSSSGERGGQLRPTHLFPLLTLLFIFTSSPGSFLTFTPDRKSVV